MDSLLSSPMQNSPSIWPSPCPWTSVASLW
jgi:hypothetical protein